MPETIGDRIRKVRIESGMSQREFAKAIYVARNTVYRWEIGKAVAQKAAAYDQYWMKAIIICAGN